MGEKSNEAEGKKECAEGAAGNEIYRAPKLMQDAVQASLPLPEVCADLLPSMPLTLTPMR